MKGQRNMDLATLRAEFIDLYGSGECMTFHSPGRVNLIGEHTDYNGGHVFPCALSLGTYGVARRRGDKRLRFASTKFGSMPVELELDNVVYNKEHEWVNYLLGVIFEFQKLGHELSGVDLLISGNMSSNAGLSSSASVELLMSVILNTLFDCKIPMVEQVKLSQRAENQFVGVSCGIMDQFAIGMGKADCAMLLDCTTLECRYIPIVLGDYSLVISNTNSPRSLSDSKYNERRAECETAARELGVNLLCELTPEQFKAGAHQITDPIILKRAQHVIYENQRTLAAAHCLEQGDLTAFGKLMNESHISLRDLYEVTGTALDTLAEAAWTQPGVLGSRMTGAGFGGCTVSLVENAYIESFIKQVGQIYQEKTGIEATFYVASIGDGTRRVDV